MHIPYLLNYISENQGSPNWSKGFNQPQSGPYSPGWARSKYPTGFGTGPKIYIPSDRASVDGWIPYVDP